MRKTPFLLLEILIALSLVMLCIVPLIVGPLNLYRSEINSLWDLEEERLAEWTFSEIKEKLLKNEIPWGRLPSEKNTSVSFNFPDATLFSTGGKSKKVKRKITLSMRAKGKQDLSGKIYRLLHVHVQCSRDSKKIYKSKPMVRKLPLEQNQTDRHASDYRGMSVFQAAYRRHN